MGKVASKIVEVVSGVVEKAKTFFKSERLTNTLMSATEIHYAPISVVLDKNHSSDLLDSMISVARSRNPKALEHVGNQLSDLGLDHINNAFKHACLEADMKCQKCEERLKNIDELCYCRTSHNFCHHTNSPCCNSRGSRGMLTFD